MCKRVSSDTPVNCASLSDLAIAPVTSTFMPRLVTARASWAHERPLNILVLFGNAPTEHNLAVVLRGRGHTVECYDLAVDPSHDLSERELQRKILARLHTFDFVFLCPPCKTASIAFEPALRDIDNPLGVANLSPRHQSLVDDANILYAFAAEVMHACVTQRIRFAAESAASRRVGPAKCRWARFGRHGFFWDIPRIAAIRCATYICFAQCAFGAAYQKYTGILVDNTSRPAFDRLFSHAQCACASHPERLQGFDDSGVSRTSKAQVYVPRLALTIASAIEEASREPAPEEACSARWRCMD